MDDGHRGHGRLGQHVIHQHENKVGHEQELVQILHLQMVDQIVVEVLQQHRLKIV